MEKLEVARQRMRDVAPLSGFEMTRAVASTCYAMAAADGEVSTIEIERMTRTLAALTDSAEDRRAIPSLFAGVAGELAARGQDAFLRDLAQKVRDPLQRRLAFRYAAVVAWANGFLDFAEEILLVHLADAFAIDEDEARRILDQVVGSRN